MPGGGRARPPPGSAVPEQRRQRPAQLALLDHLGGRQPAPARVGRPPDGGGTRRRRVHRLLLADYGNQRLLDAIEPVRNALLAYERVYMLSPERLVRSVDEHEAILDALESGDHTGASDLVCENFTSGMPEVEAQLRDRRDG